VDRDPRDDDDRAAAGAERRRVVVIVLFVGGSLALALVLAVLYSMPSAG